MGKVALVGKITHVPSMYLSELDGPRKGTRQDAIDGHVERAPDWPFALHVASERFTVIRRAALISAAGRASVSASWGMAAGLVTFSNAHNAKNWIPY